MAIPVVAAVPRCPVASPCPGSRPLWHLLAPWLPANRVVAPASQPLMLAVVPSALPLVPMAVPHACPFTRRPLPRGYPRPGRDARRA